MVDTDKERWSFDAEHGQIIDAHGWALGSVPRTIGGPSDLENGRLMAAAPELVYHLERLCGCLTEAMEFAQRVSPGTGHNAGMWHAAVQEARALIARARSEGGAHEA